MEIVWVLETGCRQPSLVSHHSLERLRNYKSRPLVVDDGR